jgi:hypothetical protein
LLALYHGHVRKIKTPDLIYASSNLEKPLFVAKSGLSPKTWIDRLGALLLEKRILVVVPYDISVARTDSAWLQRINKPSGSIFKVFSARK